MTLTYKLVLVVHSMIFSLTCYGNPTESQAKSDVAARIEKESGGIITLVSFKKTDGQDMEIIGTKAYAMDFILKLQFAKSGKWLEGEANGGIWFQVKPATPSGSAILSLNDIIEPGEIVSQGQILEAKGKMLFLKKESGWKVEALSISRPEKRVSSANQLRKTVRSDENPEVECAKNIKNIILAFKIFATANGGAFPFNVAAADGGSKEKSNPGPGGFEKLSSPHFLVLSNELSSPRSVFCPADSSKTRATRWSDFGESNVSYRIRSGATIKYDSDREVIVICPIHSLSGTVGGNIHK